MSITEAEMEWREKVIKKLTSCETLLAGLVGDGQPGRISKIETEVQSLRDAHNRQKGIVVSASVAISFLSSLAAKFLWRH